MGDGGVACVPSQHIMERFPISENFCGGNNGKFDSKSVKVKQRKMKMKVKKEDFSKNKESRKSELSSEKVIRSSVEVANGELCMGNDPKEEIEEGELGKWPRWDVENGESNPEKPRKYEIKSEIGKGDIPSEKGRKGGELDREEFVPRKNKDHTFKPEFNSGRSQSDDVPDKFKRFDPEKAEVGQWRDSKSEIDRGDTIPDRWQHKPEVVKDRMNRDDSVKGKGWRGDGDWTTPPSGKNAVEEDFNRSGGYHFRSSSSRWKTGAERIPRLGSKIVGDDSSFRSEQSNGKNYGRDYPSGNRFKRHCNDSDGGDRKHYGDYGEYSSSKSRRLSDDGSRHTYSENYSNRSVERFNRNSSSTRNMTSDRYSGRQYESSLSSRVAYDKHANSPRHSEWSPRDRPRERTPVRRERSPYERSRNFDNRNSSPRYSDRSPQDRSRYNDRKDRAPKFLEQSSLDRNRPNNHRETNRKTGGSEKRSSHYGNKGPEEKLDQKDAHGRDTHASAKESQERSTLHNGRGSVEEKVDHQSHVQEQLDNCEVHSKESPQAGSTVEDFLSMEEDMDICDTPPHAPVVLDSAPGKWFYLDHFGMERGPAKLGDLKALVEEGLLVSDHLIKHVDSDRWIAVENAVSPLVTLNFPSIVSETVTQLVSPPDAPGNLLEDVGDTGQRADLLNGELSPSLLEGTSGKDENLDVSGPVEDLHIDERVGALLEGFDVVSGQELETLGEALQIRFEHGEWHKLGSEGFGCQWSGPEEQPDQKAGDKLCSYPEPATKEAMDWSIAPADGESALACVDSNDCFFGRWSCKGGDWMRYEEASQDRSWRKKFVLNDGYPLCLMSKSGFEDPRRHHKDDLYYPSQNRKLDLPLWAFTVPDDWNDCNGVGKLSQPKPVVARGVKGAMLPVVRINSCVVNDPGSSVSEPRVKVRGKDRYTSRPARPHSGASDMRRSSEDGTSRSKSVREQESYGSPKSITSITIPKDRLCTAHELQLHLGDWYYLDGAGHERGPFSFSELQILTDQGIIQRSSSVFRKSDRVWVPVTSAAKVSEAERKVGQEICGVSKDSSRATIAETSSVALGGNSSFNSLHPQFIGFTRGKLHELVMKSYKSREFAAAINEVLDPWINMKQPKKETEKYIHSLPLHSKYQQSGKKARLLVDGSDEGYEMDEEISALQEEYTFENLCGDTTYHNEENTDSATEAGNWGLLEGHVLARVFHFLRTDVKSLVIAGSTCKHWRSVSKFYKDVSKQVDLSSVGPSCTDNALWEVMNCYRKEKITSLVLLGCTNISSAMLEEIIGLLPGLSCVDVRGCSQLADFADKYPNINWIRSRSSLSKPRGIKHTNERSSVFKNHNGLDSHMEESNGLRDYFESLDRRDSANQAFRKSLYKRSKLFDARRSSSISSRDAHLRRWAFRKSENSYKRMEQFLALGLKDIMKENSCDFFVPKVAEIEDRMKDGYYTRRGLSSVKEDIRRLCRDAIKMKNRSDAADMKRIVTLFIRLATHLEDGSKVSRERDDMIKNWKDDSSVGSGLTSVKYKKKLNKTIEKRTIRSNGSSFLNAASDYGEYASDREIRRRLSRLNKKSMDSGSETSDGLEGSSEETKTDSESSASGSETDSDFPSRGGMGESRGEGYFVTDDGFDSLTHDREWGARMTKASLVPPVTRKYEEIDHYVVVADEEEVKRKMHVSLPDDFVEKLRAQENGIEEADMEIPEVKDYKPRKQLGIEVIEQEVYGIDPYTHNLLLDSMPEALGWSLRERHLFIEDVLLRTLNKQARHFTGTGNTPMKYSLKPVIEDILKNTDNMQTVRYCESILKSINSRPEENYVAYRKGLGVVCNKDGGFDKDDFVVEFLGEVYPAWKWYEKQDGIRSLQKNSKDPVPEFYNINLERPKGDADGYDLVVVDAMHKANYASRICHSCRPNCEAKVTAVDGQYQIGIYAVRPIEFGEEITFDYNSVTESKEEYDSSVCLCGSQVCRGSYLNLTGEGAFQKVLKEWHGILDRHHLLLEACELNSVSEEDYIDLSRAGLGSCLLGGLPDWLIAYSARLVRFINFERTKLPEEILRHNVEEKKKYYTDAEISIDVEKSDAEVQAEGVYNQRLQNLALTLDKVRYVMRCVFGDPKKAPPPLERLSPEAIVSVLWKGEGSLVHDLIECMAPHIDDVLLKDLMSKICGHDPSGSNDIQKELRKSLIWLRDEVRGLPCTYKSRHDAAADLIHVYAHTKCFFRIREYKSVTSPPVYISPLDLGPKYSDKMGPGFQEYCKTYGENYCLGQLIYWHNQTYTEPDSVLARACRGCLSLPDIGSFYAKIQKPSRHRVYGPRTAKFMLSRMEKQPQRPWPNDRIWSFKESPKIIGSPMLDAVLYKSQLDRDMVNWLKLRPAIFQAKWDI